MEVNCWLILTPSSSCACLTSRANESSVITGRRSSRVALRVRPRDPASVVIHAARTMDSTIRFVIHLTHFGMLDRIHASTRSPGERQEKDEDLEDKIRAGLRLASGL